MSVDLSLAAAETQKALDGKIKQLLRVGLAANTNLFLSGAMFVRFYTRELTIQWWTRDVLGDVLYSIGFATLILSAVLEMWIDIGLVRTFGHGRYTTKRYVNMFITGLFALGTVGDLIAFLFWRQGREGIREEHITQWVSTHLFLFTAVIVIITNRPQYVPFQNRLDSMANIFFLCEAVLACASRYVSEIGDTKRNDTEMYLELASAAFMMASGIGYMSADLIRLSDPDSIIYD